MRHLQREASEAYERERERRRCGKTSRVQLGNV